MDRKVSVIVPVYNVEKYLPDCMKSLLEQNYENLEIILVDDGSPDRCGAMCDEYATENKNVIVIHQENQGVSAARNHGLEIATGEYISFVDPDDMVDRNTYAVTVAAMEKENADIGRFDHSFFSTLTDVENKSFENTSGNYKVYQGIDRVNQVIRKYRSACLGIYKSSVIRTLRFPEQYSIGEDGVFLCGALLSAEKVLVLERAFYLRRINMSSVTRSPYKSSWLHVLDANKDIESMLLKENKEYRNIAAYTFYRQSSILIFSMKDSYKKYSSDINSAILPEMRKRWRGFMLTPYLTAKEKIGISVYCISRTGFYLMHRIYKNIKIISDN